MSAGTDEFEADLQRVRADLTDARAELLAVVGGLSENDFDRSRRGGWSIEAVLLHVIGSERHYANGIAFIRGTPPETPPDGGPELRTGGDAVRILEQTRQVLLSAIEGIDEESFYKLSPLTNEEGYGQTYSVLSILENVALHDREHAAQIESILAAARA